MKEIKRREIYYADLSPVVGSEQGGGLAKDSVVLLEQIRTLDKSRLNEYIGELEYSAMQKVDRAIVISFGIHYLEELLK